MDQQAAMIAQVDAVMLSDTGTNLLTHLAGVHCGSEGFAGRITDVVREAGIVEMSDEYFSNKFLRDYWGRRLMVFPAENGQVPGVLKERAGPDATWILWSVGRNGRNEFGAGDDLIPASKIGSRDR